MKKENILDIVKKTGAGYVLTTTLVSVDRKTEYHPPQTYVSPRFGGYYGYYYRAYDVVHEPGYYTTRVKVSLESTLYSVKSEKPVWIARSQTMNPESSTEVIKSVIPELVEKMKEAGLLN
jgi:hypothetical protein